jgi:Mg-chelatase subunit ChlD
MMKPSRSRREKAMPALRAAAIIAALLAFAGVSLPFPTRARTVVALIDASDSVGGRGAAVSREAAITLFRGLGKKDRAAVIVFAGKALVLSPPVPPAQAAAILEAATLAAPSPGSSDLAAAIAAAKALAAEGPGSRSIFLFRDGRSNAGASPADAALAPREYPSRQSQRAALPEG